MAPHTHSAACCTIPPIISEGYEAKGKYEEINGIKTYVTGPSDASTAILIIFDIFGFFPQSLQGADILATSDEHNKYQIFMPDWFDGKPADISWYPPKTDEQGKKLNDFFSGVGAPPKTIARVNPFVEAAASQYSSIKKWGAVGFCWGGKVVSLISTDGTPFSAIAECHPAMVDPSDAPKITVPICLLASKDEPADDVTKFEENLKVEKHVETFGDQIHGWMAARADLEDAKVKSEYERGYKTLLDFFGKHL